jgi:sialic acid synthase SpsE/sugar phosphate isomerase/epimerase
MSVFIIAEIGINHNGSMDLAKELIQHCKDSGADSAKFQMRNINALYRNDGDYKDEDLSSQYVLDILSQFNLSNEQMFELFDFCKEVDIMPMCTPWDQVSFDALEDYGMQCYKTASADLTNHQLLTSIAKTGKKMFVSTGMSTENEISQTNDLLKRLKADYVLMHCNSTYPTPFKDINLNYIKKLEELSRRPVGYSGHERGIHIPVAAVALGASVIEKHITVDKKMQGNDHKVSLLPNEFKEMITLIRQTEEATQVAGERKCSPGELINREALSKSIVAERDIQKGQVITREDLCFKSPGRGLQPNRLRDVLDKVAKRDIPKGYFLYENDIRDTMKGRDYEIPFKWGLPVRFHDYNFFIDQSNVKFLEFHLSYKDLSYNIKELFKNVKYNIDLTVHAPDLFEHDHLIDLSSENVEYRQRSITNLKRVINITRKLRPFFNTEKKTKIISSLGGFTRNEWMSESDKEQAYDRVASALKELVDEETEIIIQTVPPFPWYFGGQLLLNLFAHPDEIVSFCKDNNYKICFDTSHSKLFCNHFKYDMSSFIDKVYDYVSHVHVSDALDVDKEGLQIGEGDIDFNYLLQNIPPSATIMPEIWQGHKNFGESCWIALDKIESITKGMK